MTFDSVNTSRELSEPVELFEFVIPGTNSAWHYTSSEFPITFGGQVYSPEAIKRTTVTIESGRLDGSTDILVPEECGVAQALFLGLAARPVEVRVISMFPGDEAHQIEFTGIFTAINFDGATAKITCGSRYSMAVKRKVLWATFQAGCNLAWGSQRCGVSKEQYSTLVMIGPMDVEGSVVNISALNAAQDYRYNSGYVKRVSDGDTRFIQNQIAGSVTLSGMFPNLLAAEEFIIYPGCKKTEKDCDITFGNLENYLGWTHLPSINPFNRSAYYQTGAAIAPPAGSNSSFPGLDGYSVKMSDVDVSYVAYGQFTLTLTFRKNGHLNVQVSSANSIFGQNELGNRTSYVIGTYVDQNLPGCWADPLPLPNDTAAGALQMRMDGVVPTTFPNQYEVYQFPSLPQDATGWVSLSDRQFVITGAAFPSFGIRFDFTVRLRAAPGYGSGVVLTESTLSILLDNPTPAEIPYGA